MHKEPQGPGSGVARAVLALGRDKEIVPGLDRLPAAIDIGLAMALDHKDGISLFFMCMDGGFRTGAISIRQTLAISDSLLVISMAALTLSNVGCLVKIISRWG